MEMSRQRPPAQRTSLRKGRGHTRELVSETQLALGSWGWPAKCQFAYGGEGPSQPSRSPGQGEEVRPRAVSGGRPSGRVGELGSPPPPPSSRAHLEQALALLPAGARTSAGRTRWCAAGLSGNPVPAHSCDNQSVPWGTKMPLAEDHCSPELGTAPSVSPSSLPTPRLPWCTPPLLPPRPGLPLLYSGRRPRSPWSYEAQMILIKDWAQVPLGQWGRQSAWAGSRACYLNAL